MRRKGAAKRGCPLSVPRGVRMALRRRRWQRPADDLRRLRCSRGVPNRKSADVFRAVRCTLRNRDFNFKWAHSTLICFNKKSMRDSKSFNGHGNGLIRFYT